MYIGLLTLDFAAYILSVTLATRVCFRVYQSESGLDGKAQIETGAILTAQMPCMAFNHKAARKNIDFELRFDDTSV